VLDWEAKGANFLDKFNFMTHDDYSHGFVNYVNQSYAQCTLPLLSPAARSLRLAPRAADLTCRLLLQLRTEAKGLVSVVGGKVKLRTDTTNVVASGSRGRDSVRLESKINFNGGLFIADVEHIPTGCGASPLAPERAEKERDMFLVDVL
jgi:hypothetical protein